VILLVGLAVCFLYFSYFTSSFALYGEVVMIFAEPALEGQSFMTCFEIEGRGLWLAARTSLLDETVGMVEVDAIGSSEIFRRCHCRSIRSTGFT
jgi:hypothetical protein